MTIDQLARAAGVSPEALAAAQAIFELDGMQPLREGWWNEDYPHDAFVADMARVIDREIRK